MHNFFFIKKRLKGIILEYVKAELKEIKFIFDPEKCYSREKANSQR